jgi:hypothetical protein
MIININKLTDIRKITFDLTTEETCIYFLFQIDENTLRYNRVNGKLVEDKNGTFIMDNGPNFFKQELRTLAYIGQTKNFISRINEHYWAGVKGKDKNKQSSVKKFNYFRMIKNIKAFQYDTVRSHYERVLVRKFLPYYNNASEFSENQIRLIKNSNGRINPRDLTKPYVINLKDIIKASIAWKTEDPEYLKNEFAKPISKMRELTKMEVPNKKYYPKDLSYYRYNKKYNFGKFVDEIIIPFHKKQRKAIVEARQKLKTWIKIFDPERYKFDVEKAKVRSKDNYEANKEFILKRQNEYKKILKKLTNRS